MNDRIVFSLVSVVAGIIYVRYFVILLLIIANRMVENVDVLLSNMSYALLFGLLMFLESKNWKVENVEKTAIWIVVFLTINFRVLRFFNII